MEHLPDGPTVAAAVARRHRQLADALSSLDASTLAKPSRLPGWDRLTIVCHLRYGALASRRMTDDAMAGRPTAFYPEGRDAQRNATLAPGEGESPVEAVASLVRAGDELDRCWAEVPADRWDSAVTEPTGNRDLGPITLATLALLRLTEVEVHGTDLDLALPPWSDTFVASALPARLHWLPTRRANHREADASIVGRWWLRSTDGGPIYAVTAEGNAVTVSTVVGSEAAPADTVTLAGPGRDLLAFLLGRLPLSSLDVAGDRARADTFLAAFPPP